MQPAAVVTACDLFLGLSRFIECAVGQHRHIWVQHGIEPVDALQVRSGDLHRRERPSRERVRKLSDRCVARIDVAHIRHG